MKLLKIIFAAAVMMLALPLSYHASAYSAPYYYSGENEEAERYIASQVESFSATINVFRFDLTSDEVDELLEDIILSRSDIFYLVPEYRYAVDRNTGRVVFLYPDYWYEQGTINERRRKMNEAADDIIAGMDSSWSDIQKALYLHDAIAVRTVYDKDHVIRSSYEVLAGGSGLCVDYSLAYKFLADRIGLECVIVMNNDINHCWNMVKCKGKWYHVDVTQDDTIPNFEGLVSHDYCLVSDKTVRGGRNPHTGKMTHGYSAADTGLDDMFWKTSATQIIPYSKALWYYIDSKKGKICSYNWNSGRSTQVAAVGYGWYADSRRSDRWMYVYSRLTRYGDLIYYNTADSVYVYDIAAKKSKRVKKFTFTGSTAIYGLAEHDGVLVINTADSPKDRKYKTHRLFRLGGAESVPISPPTGVRCTVTGASSVTISWQPVEGADGYQVCYFDISTRRTTPIAKTRSTTYTDSGLDDGGYFYVVRAYHTDGESTAYSNTSAIVSAEL